MEKLYCDYAIKLTKVDKRAVLFVTLVRPDIYVSQVEKLAVNNTIHLPGHKIDIALRQIYNIYYPIYDVDSR
jgi:hypothetical protein